MDLTLVGGLAKNAVKGGGGLVLRGLPAIEPSAVRFSQRSMGATFSNGTSIDELAQGLRMGTVNPMSIPPIRLVERNGLLFTLDNRRLYAFQRTNVPVPYRMATPAEISAQGWKFTTRNNGISIRVRGR